MPYVVQRTLEQRRDAAMKRDALRTARREFAELRRIGKHVYVIDRRMNGYELNDIAARIGRSRATVQHMEWMARRLLATEARAVRSAYSLQCLVALGWG